MMEEGMSYSEYYKLKEENEEELARLYFFVLEQRKEELRMMEESNPNKPQGRKFVAP